MKDIEVLYKLHGSIKLLVHKDVKLTDESIIQLLRDQLDKDLISGIEIAQYEIDGDAIELVGFVLPDEQEELL